MESSIRASRPTRRASITPALILLFCSAASGEQQDHQQRDYPRGAGAMPLLHEAWSFSAGNIYPESLASAFDTERLAELEHELRSDEELGLADVLNPFLETLGVSHTRFLDTRHQTYYLLRSLFSTRNLDEPALFTLGIQLDDRTPGRIRAVLDGSPAAAAGLRREDRILRVDGEAFTSLLQWQEAGPVRLDVRSRDGDREFTIRPLRQSFHRALARATSDSRRVIRCDDRRFIYLHLWAGTHEIFREALVDAVALANAEELDGFVLDLRDGYGGAWWPYLDSFFPNRESYFTATIVDRDGEGGTLRAEPQDNAHAFSGPLAVLINEGTRSGKESLAFQFEKTGRARLFGTKTAGAFTGGMGVFAERDAPYMLYLSVQESRLDGQRIEGIGVEPDIVTPDDSAEDRALLAALAHLGCRDGMN